MRKRITKDKEPLNVVKTVRITETQDNKLNKLGLNIRDAINWYIATKENPREQLKERKRIIENEIKTKENEIKQLRFELEEIIKEIGVKTDMQENTNLDALMDAQKIVEAYKKNEKQKLRHTKMTLRRFDEFLEMNNQAKRMIKHFVDENGEKDKDKYENELKDNAREQLKKELK